MRKFLSAIVLLAFISCAAPKPLVYKNVEHLGMDHLGLGNTTISMDLVLYNPNHYKIKMKSAAVDVYFNGTHIGKAIVDQQFIIPKKDTFAMPVLLKVDLLNLIPGALQLVTKKQVTLKLKGEMRAGRSGVSINIPVDYEGKQSFR